MTKFDETECMNFKYLTYLVALVLYISFTGFKPPKNTFPKGDILYSKYGGNVDSMMAGERKLDSMARPFLYQMKEEAKGIYFIQSSNKTSLKPVKLIKQ